MLVTGCGTANPWLRLLYANGDHNHQACVVSVDTIQCAVSMQSVCAVSELCGIIQSQLPEPEVHCEHPPKVAASRTHCMSGLVRVKGVSLSLLSYGGNKARRKLATFCIGRVNLWPKATPEFSKCHLTVARRVLTEAHNLLLVPLTHTLPLFIHTDSVATTAALLF